ncbi:hypothetical protein [Bradyrhizobium guangzhouense]|uniref:hypothetical protein n=1 Tax=Bradyrhizobium guangzhouense TaxID=1325095 RepID=UPI001009A48C|nr:hypothetical protein [Bradyrhizobium guangzhouense]RXH13924.1 hypothetical protein EAS54_22765 [Bradyrhizobium guangzhouense]
MLREALRDFLRFFLIVDFGCAAVLFFVVVRETFFRAGEYWDRSSSLLSLRRPQPSEFSNEYYASWRRSVWLAIALLVVLAMGALLLWLDMLVFGPEN